MNEITITNTNGVLTVSSLQVAKDFGKQHKHVLETIEELKKGVAENSADPLKCSKFKVSDYFIETTYQHPQNKQWYKCYNITRDGFSLLVMGFTGKKALEWKLKYIEAFNRMEKQLININSNIEEVVKRVLSENVKEVVRQVLNENVEEIIKKSVKESVEEAVSETVKVLAPFMKVPDNEYLLTESTENKIIRKPYKYTGRSKIFSLSSEIIQQVDKMIISGEYSCQQIADFIKESSGMDISYMTVSRYKHRYFIMQT